MINYMAYFQHFILGVHCSILLFTLLAHNLHFTLAGFEKRNFVNNDLFVFRAQINSWKDTTRKLQISPSVVLSATVAARQPINRMPFAFTTRVFEYELVSTPVNTIYLQCYASEINHI